MVTYEDALEHLGIDYADEVVERNVKRALAAGVAMMHGAVGEDVETYLPDDPRIDQLVLIYTGEVYDSREASQKQASVRSRLSHDLELQLKLELRRAVRGAMAAAGGGTT